MTFRTEGALDGPTHVRLVSREHLIEVDEPAVLAGGDAHANPVEYALASLASCQAITYRFWAAKLGVQLDGLEIAAEGDLDLHGFFGLDSDVRPGFTAIRLEVTPLGRSRRSAIASSPTRTARCSTCSPTRPRSSAAWPSKPRSRGF